jgi:hypothetical protein
LACACAKPGAERNRHAIAVEGFFWPPERAQRIANIVVRRGGLGGEGDGPVEARERFLRPAELLQDVAEIAVGVGVGRVRGDRLGDQLGRLLVLAGLVQRDAEQVERRRVVRVRLEDLPVCRGGPVQPAGFVVPHSGLELLLQVALEPRGISSLGHAKS